MAVPSPNLSKSLIEDAAGGVAAAGKTVVKYWPTLVACIVVSAATALSYSKATPKIYQAATILEMAPKASQPLREHDNPGLELGIASYWDAHEYYETQYKVLTSDRLLGLVVRDLGLRSDASYLGLSAPPASPVPEKDVIDRVRTQIAIEPVKNTRLFQIKIEDTNPERAQRIANGLATEFVDQNLQGAISANSESVEWLNGQVEHVKQDLDQNENALHKFKEDNDLPSTSINEASNSYRLEMEAFDSALTATRTRKQELLARQAGLALPLSTRPSGRNRGL